VEGDVIYCEMCGSPVDRKRVKTVFVEGALLRVCESCYSKVMSRRAPPPQSQQPTRLETLRTKDIVRPRSLSRPPTAPATISGPSTGSRRARVGRSLERYELVEDYARRIREARERLGWSTKVLAMKVRESETTIKRIESGKLRPTLDLARRLEEVLGIKLLVPAVEEEIGVSSREPEGFTTLGEIVNVRGEEV